MNREIKSNKKTFQNGKGYNRRPYDYEKYSTGYDSIDWHHDGERPEYRWLKELGPEDLQKPGLVPIRKFKK